MRQLTTNDVFKMSRILKRLNLNASEIKIPDGDDSDQQVMIFVTLKILENLHFAQNEVNDFIGDLCGMSGEEFGNLPITESIQKIKEFRNLDGLESFFEHAGQLMN